MILSDTTITEDGNVINHEEHGIISVHIGLKQMGQFQRTAETKTKRNRRDPPLTYLQALQTSLS